MAVGTIIVIVAVVLAFLDLVLWYTTEYKRHVLLQFAVIALGIALLIGAPSIGT